MLLRVLRRLILAPLRQSAPDSGPPDSGPPDSRRRGVPAKGGQGRGRRAFPGDLLIGLELRLALREHKFRHLVPCSPDRFLLRLALLVLLLVPLEFLASQLVAAQGLLGACLELTLGQLVRLSASW